MIALLASTNILASTNLKISAQKFTTEDAEDTEEAMAKVWRFLFLVSLLFGVLRVR